VDIIELRDRIAIAAMRGLIARGAETVSYISKRAYEIADGMLVAREPWATDMLEKRREEQTRPSPHDY
jgi:hypothetical protein